MNLVDINVTAIVEFSKWKPPTNNSYITKVRIGVTLNIH